MSFNGDKVYFRGTSKRCRVRVDHGGASGEATPPVVCNESRSSFDKLRMSGWLLRLDSSSGDGVAVVCFGGWTPYQAMGVAVGLIWFPFARVSRRSGLLRAGRCQCAADSVRMVVCPVFPVAHINRPSGPMTQHGTLWLTLGL